MNISQKQFYALRGKVEAIERQANNTLSQVAWMKEFLNTLEDNAQKTVTIEDEE